MLFRSNSGFRTRISGETDFPCIYGERVGLGRSYVKLDGRLTYNDWCEGIRQGRNYVGDGRSHLIDFQVGQGAVGVNGSAMNLDQPGKATAKLKAAAFLPRNPNPKLRDRPYEQKPFWHVERARVGDSRDVVVEIIVNGIPVKKTTLHADGTMQDLSFEIPIEHSSWVAARILPSSHTNPVWGTVGHKPVRASKRSAEWCLAGVKKCRSQKRRFMGEDEIADFNAAYDHAEKAYRRIIGESVTD